MKLKLTQHALLKGAVLALAVSAISVGSFFAGRTLLRSGPTEAQVPPPGSTTEEERIRLWNEEFAKPRFEGVTNSIRIYQGPDGIERKSACDKAKPVQAPLSTATGTPLEVNPG